MDFKITNRAIDMFIDQLNAARENILGQLIESSHKLWRIGNKVASTKLPATDEIKIVNSRANGPAKIEHDSDNSYRNFSGSKALEMSCILSNLNKKIDQRLSERHGKVHVEDLNHAGLDLQLGPQLTRSGEHASKNQAGHLSS